MVADHFNIHGSWYERIPQDRLRCIIENMRQECRSYYHVHALWTLVGAMFGVGSTTAMHICVTAGLKPDDRVKPRRTQSVTKHG
jgi:hypothetical protein